MYEAEAREIAQEIVIASAVEAGYVTSSRLDPVFKHHLTERITAEILSLATSARADALEEAAKVADEVASRTANLSNPNDGIGLIARAHQQAGAEIGKSIRSLVDKEEVK